MRLALSSTNILENLRITEYMGSVAHLAAPLLDARRRLIDTSSVMKVRAWFAIYWAAMTMAGCSAPPATISVSPTPDLTGNWQIQSNVDTSQIPPAGVLLVGALQNTGSQVSGTFRFSNLAQPAQCGLDQVVTVTGSLDSKNNLALTSSALPNGNTVKIALAINAAQAPYYSGTIEVDGTACTFPSTTALGAQIANATGTYTGTLPPGTVITPGTGPSAMVSLAFTQSATPQADGQFPVTGTLNYTVGTCSGSVSLSGTISGVGLILSTPGGLLASPQASFIGGVSPAATSISAGSFYSDPAPCSTDPTSSATYSGTLTHH